MTDNRQQIPVHNPVTGESISHIPVMTAEEVHTAAERARRAQPEWEALDPRERARRVARWGEQVWQRRDELMRVIRSESGKTDVSAFLEIIVIDNITDFYVHHAPAWLRPKSRRPLLPFIQRAKVYYKPYGVVGFITPWNYPHYNVFTDVVPALLAGNAVIIKPSEITPLTAQWNIDLMHECGIPHDIAQVVHGAGTTGAALIDEVDYIAFTGSTATGRKIAIRAAERLIPCSLELGGKDPMIVLSDAEIDIAASGAVRGSMENAGQMCVSIERVYVEAPIHDAFVERVRHYIAQLNIGTGDGFDVHIGSMTNERELQRVEAQVADAVAKGAKIVAGGKRRPDIGPLFYEPTVLVNVDHTMQVMRDETFGPLLPIMRVRDADEAVRLANDSPYGLSGSVYSNDLQRAEQIARRICSGDVTVNQAMMVIGTPTLPMGGRKESGLGRRNGQEGFMRFLTSQTIVVDRQTIAKDNITYIEPVLLNMVMFQRRWRKYIPFLRM